MLKYLRIQNIILIDNEEILFERGLNAITGETGSGKSALIEAFGLIVGERADHTILRKGCDRGVVEAGFDIDGMSGIQTILEQAGIEHSADELLIVRRELSATGKSRCLINNQMAQLAILRELGTLLVDRVGQHANQRLRNVESHLQLLDLFTDTAELAAQVKEEWRIGLNVRKKLDALVNSEPQRLRDIEVCRMELEELQEAQFKEGEEEELFAEYALLSNSEERGTKAQELVAALSEDKISVLGLLNRHLPVIEDLARLDISLEESFRCYRNASIELEEVFYALRNYRDQIEQNPERTATINKRLTILNRLKKKYGATVQEIAAYQTKTQAKLRTLEGADEQIADLHEDLQASDTRCAALCAALTVKRQQGAKDFEQAIVGHLQALNMPKAAFHVRITPKKRSEQGEDEVEFFLQPNVGEHPVAIKECASGGELSRLMLAIQTILAGKERIPILIFDEIDSNIGGQTAVAVGDKLCEIGKNHQVLCITHFQQVACQADHHVQIYKQEEEGRTVTRLRALDHLSRENELARMLGVM